MTICLRLFSGSARTFLLAGLAFGFALAAARGFFSDGVTSMADAGAPEKTSAVASGAGFLAGLAAAGAVSSAMAFAALPAAVFVVAGFGVDALAAVARG